MKKRNAYFDSKFETREAENGEKRICGYFAVFGAETELWERHYEQIASGAFTNSLVNNDIRCLFNHDTGFVLGRKSAGTLTLREDDHGLYGEVIINDADPQAVAVYERVKRGDISGCSFGFEPKDEGKIIADDGSVHWTVREADTIEVSICTFPAYPQTEISARMADAEKHKENELAKRKCELKKRMEELHHGSKKSCT